MMKIIEITVLLTSHGADILFLKFDGLEGEFPFTQQACAKMTCARGTGGAYARERFPGIPLTKIDTSTGTEEKLV